METEPVALSETVALPGRHYSSENPHHRLLGSFGSCYNSIASFNTNNANETFEDCELSEQRRLQPKFSHQQSDKPKENEEKVQV
jgi:hypothetical protein